MNWEQTKCGRDDCRLDHFLYYDESTDELVGIVSGPGAFGSWEVGYRGEEIGRYRTSDKAMERLQAYHEAGGRQERPPFDVKKFMAVMVPALEELKNTGLLAALSPPIHVPPMGEWVVPSLPPSPLHGEPGIYWALYHGEWQLARWDGEDWRLLESGTVCPRSHAVMGPRLDPSEPPQTGLEAQGSQPRG